MEYLLVLQLPSSSSLGEYDLLISLEESIREGIGDFATVDGHDIGSGEMNIFLFTENPKLAFERIRTIPSVASHMSNLRVGYREVGEDEYTPLYPEGLQVFAVV
jgi:hypothetical protein